MSDVLPRVARATRATAIVITVIGALLATATATSARAATLSKDAPRPDPLSTAAVRHYLGKRAGKVSIAVEDLDAPLGPPDVKDAGHRAGHTTKRQPATVYREWLLNPGRRYQTASIVKADILETLLHDHGGPLTGSPAATATGMIEQSDNDDATDLWHLAGGAGGVAAYDRDAGLTDTSPNDKGYWGETLTTPADQVRLLGRLALASDVLTPAERRYQLGLMEHVDSDQRWGVSGGVPHNVQIALKNGWMPLKSYSDWEINSIGWVDGDRHDYLIAVLTAHDPSEQYGIDTVDHLSSLIYKHLTAAPTN
jgi:hypothetical protein